MVDVVDALVAGTFDWYEDTSQAIHAISSKALYDAIAPLLGITINVLFEQYIKVGESGYSKTGNWNFFSQTADGVEVAASPFNGVATWEFTGLASGVYDIFASWSADANRTTAAPYTVFDNNTQVASVAVNQEVAPDQFTSPTGQVMDRIARVQISSGVCRVRLSAVANNDNANFVIASTVRLVRQTYS